MADTLDCSPCYEGRPDYDPNLGTAILPIYNARRSRLFTGGTYFRSKLNYAGDSDFQGSICNDIELEVTVDGTIVTLRIYFQNALVESYTTSQPIDCPISGSGAAIGSLRSQTSGSSYISMPARDTDPNDPGGADSACISASTRSSMSGGSGPSEADVPSIRTGPDRTLAFIRTKENSAGTVVDSNSLQQWDFDALQWIAYIQDADCALPENRCP
jgi:hypothetical protein